MEVSTSAAQLAQQIPMGKEAGGFNFDLCARNATLTADMGKHGQRMPQPMSTGCAARGACPVARVRA